MRVHIDINWFSVLFALTLLAAIFGYVMIIYVLCH